MIRNKIQINKENKELRYDEISSNIAFAKLTFRRMWLEH